MRTSQSQRLLLVEDTAIESESARAKLLSFNSDVIDQALGMIFLCESHNAAANIDIYAGPISAHLRHVIEHYDALLSPADDGVVDYDTRVRDRDVERSSGIARERLLGLKKRLAANSRALDSTLVVPSQTGLAGEFSFTAASTFGRELVFVASHALHHYALIRHYCQAAGILLDADFGKAPSTVAHERATQATQISS